MVMDCGLPNNAISLISDIENINTSGSRPRASPPHRLMDLKQIEYFLRVAERRSFARGRDAGRGPTHPEPAGAPAGTGTGQHLLYRNGRGVEPTEAGLRFVEHARALLALAERAREDLRSLRETPAGKVSVGLPPRIARVLTPPLVQAFRREFPGASIAVAEGLSAQVREWLLAGRVDLALLYDPAPHLSWPASRCSAKTWCWPPPRRSARAARTRRGQGPGRLSAGAAQPAQRHPHTGRQRLPRPGRAPAGGGRGRRGADHRRAGRAGRCLRHLPRSAARGPAAEHALALADIVAPASSTTWCWRPPATVPRRGWPRPPPN